MIRAGLLLFLLAATLAGGGILALHSYHRDYPWTDGQHRGFLEKIGKRGTVLTEYLDAKRLAMSPEQEARFADYLAWRYEEWKPVLIYATDDAAFSFLLRWRDRLFPGTPVFFSGVNDPAAPERAAGRKMTGVLEKKEAAPNLALVAGGKKKVRLLFVGDETPTNRAIETAVRNEAARRFPGTEFRFIMGRELETVLHEIKEETYDALFLTTIGGFLDRQGVPLSPAEAGGAIVAATDKPVIAMEDGYLFPGVVGGYVTSGEEQGRAAGALAAAWLDGTPLESLPVVTESPNRYLFDSPALKAHGIVLPPSVEREAVILHAPRSFYLAHQGLILWSLGGLAALLFITMAVSTAVARSQGRRLKENRDALMEGTRRLEEAQQVAHVGNWVWEITTGELYWSDEIYRIFGYEPGAFPATYAAFLRAIHPEDRVLVEARVNESLESGEAYHVEHRILRPGGRVRWVREEGLVVRRKEGPSRRMVGTVQDITEKKEAEEALKTSHRQLEILNANLAKRASDEQDKRELQEKLLMRQSRLAQMGEMIGAIAHQWRQPLNALGLLIQDLEDARGFGELDDAYLRDTVERSMQQINYMSRTINDFRNFFKPVKEKVAFGLEEVVEESAEILRAQLRHHQVRVEIDDQSGGGLRVFGYPTELKQVVVNLISNGKDAILEHRGNDGGTIRITMRKEGEKALLSIRDQGGGVPEAIMERIFDPYFSTKEEGSGTGLGLYMAKLIVEEHMDGRLWVENREDGACFVLELECGREEEG